MAFDAAFNSTQLPAMLLHFGEAATYTPVVGDAVSILAVVDKSLQLRPGETTKSQGQGNRVRISFAAEAITPARGDTITIDTATYTVFSVDSNDGGVVSVMAVKQVEA